MLRASPLGVVTASVDRLCLSLAVVARGGCLEVQLHHAGCVCSVAGNFAEQQVLV